MDFLPIGTVVTLKGGVKSMMIIGYHASPRLDAEPVYDYMGVLYPEGFIGKRFMFMFNHADIMTIESTGYVSEDCEKWMDFLTQREE